MSENIVEQTATRTVPFSPFQKIWLVDQQQNNGPLRSTFASFWLDGPLNIELTEHVLEEISRRHETLRTTIQSKGNRRYQWVAADSRPALSVVNLEGLTGSQRSAAVERNMDEVAVRQIDLTTERAARVTLIRLEGNLHLLLLTAHPIACDATSAGLFGAEFTKLYEAFGGGGPAALPEHRFQYREFVKSHRRWLRDGSGGSDITYWRSEVARLSGRCRDFGDQAPSGHLGVTVGAEKIIIPALLCQDLRRLAEDHSVDLGATLLAPF